MSFWSSASGASIWRGYDYFKEGKVEAYEQLAENIFESRIQGSAEDPYHTVIDIEHPKRSHCDCPFAKDRRVVCKHMVALCAKSRNRKSKKSAGSKSITKSSNATSKA